MRPSILAHAACLLQREERPRDRDRLRVLGRSGFPCRLDGVVEVGWWIKWHVEIAAERSEPPPQRRLFGRIPSVETWHRVYIVTTQQVRKATNAIELRVGQKIPLGFATRVIAHAPVT